jgi:catechol 2,3-dioxygenase-like lactoylglutathione lyase family enzyme
MTAFEGCVVFFRTHDLEAIRAFYEVILGLRPVLEQDICLIYKAACSSYLGFCEEGCMVTETGSGVVVTLVTADVDRIAGEMREAGARCVKEPAYDPRFMIYNCFFEDPDGRIVEIQRFENPRWQPGSCRPD